MFVDIFINGIYGNVYEDCWYMLLNISVNFNLWIFVSLKSELCKFVGIVMVINFIDFFISFYFLGFGV